MPITKKKKLFVIINRLAHAGGSVDALSMSYYLTDEYDVTIVYGEKEKDEENAPLLLDYSKITFIKLHSLRRSILPLRDLFTLKKLLGILRKHKPNIVHTHSFKSGLLGRIAAKLSGVPVIIHTYHGHLFHSYYNKIVSGIIRRVEKQLANISTRIVAISPRQKYELTNTYRIAPAEKITTIYIGIDKTTYGLQSSPVGTFRQRYHIAANTVIIAIIGRLVTIKNHHFFIDVAQKIKEQEKDVCFMIIGDGYLKKNIQTTLTKRNILWKEGTAIDTPADIIFTSWITRIAEALQDIDIVMLTSLNEGTPVSLIEAQLFERPVVATNVGGVRDTIIDGKTGFLINNFDVFAFAEKLCLLVHDRALQKNMGKAGKAFTETCFSKMHEVECIKKLYRECLEECERQH